MSKDGDAREGRGAGNSGNANWYNSPLWDNIEKKKVEYKPVKEDKSLEEMTEKERQKKLFGMFH